MKLKFLAIVTVFIVILTSLTGCSCSPANILEFNSNFTGSTDGYPSNYTEVCEYSVELNTDSASSSIKDNLPEINGTFVTTLEISNNLEQDLRLLLQDKTTDLLDDVGNRGVSLYRYTTDFNVAVKHDCIKNTNEFIDDNGTQIPNPHYNKDGINNDKIKTVVYFLSNSGSFAPIYTTTTYNYTNFALTATQGQYLVNYAQCETLYRKNNYTLTEYYGYNLSDVENKLNKYEKTINYTYKSLIDNSQLLFAIRNMAFNSDSNTLLPVVSYQYDDFKNLMFTTASSSATGEGFKVNYNDKDYTSTILKPIAFKINSQYASGLMQTLYIQEKETTPNENSLPFNSLLCKYEKPLLEYASNMPMGTLVHTLTKVTII